MRSAGVPSGLNHAETFGAQFIAVSDVLGRYEETAREAADACVLLSLGPAARVLDAGCGFGRFSTALADLGMEVVGVDLSQEALGFARDRDTRPTYVQADMTQPLALGRFDAVVNVFSSFGYGETVDADRRVLRGWADSLRAGGGLLMELSDIERARARLGDGRPQVRSSGPDVQERLFVDWETSILHVTYVSEQGALQTRTRLYSCAQLVGMLEQTGFVTIQAFGDFRGGPKRPDGRLVLLARRGEDAQCR